ncbi:outer membrane protein assembly factor BamE [Shimia aestuarii]|uniref:Beta-barrel assembly machine subunit BamE n=1 Tax=Shimia aestuarii TaxID=254406 RepID=A0A1I4NCU8_9RHOB|nr:outer membrane protein assembly factor BamE [Shimia aestuarii]SFM13318.1 Beta-barrel assembly machine subunit BamE [Shimia aestuarii]
MARRGKALKSIVFGAALLVAVSCTTQYRNHGYVPSSEDLAAVTLGVDTRDTVAESLGTPSAGGVLDDSGYYYVRSKVRHFGAMKPEVIERQVVAINFDSRGIARNVQHYSLQDGKVVPLVRRITDNGLTETSVIKALLGNIGNFSPTTFGG